MRPTVFSMSMDLGSAVRKSGLPADEASTPDPGADDG